MYKQQEKEMERGNNSTGNYCYKDYALYSREGSSGRGTGSRSQSSTYGSMSDGNDS